MGFLSSAAKWLGRDSAVVRTLQPVREATLNFRYGRGGMPRRVNGLDIRVAPKHRAWFPETYDESVAHYFRARAKHGMTAASIGANLGVYAIQMASWVGPTGRVFAFEPNPTTATDLERHLAMNGLSERVRTVRSAVGETAGTARFFAAGTEGTSRLGEPNPKTVGASQPIDVPVVVLDEFFSAAEDMPNLIMMDIEGYECEAIRGGSALIRSGRIAAFVVEMHPFLWQSTTTPESFANTLDSLGMKAVGLSGQQDLFRDYGHIALERH
jgi:FkbM family methyltransferase